MQRILWVMMLAVVAMTTPADAKRPTGAQDPNPIIFVHGGSGSGAQFATQAMRFRIHGYPTSHLAVVEYDSGGLDPASSADAAFLYAAIDARIAELQAATGAAQIDLIGHSRGTTISHGYLADPARAANVAHYVNIDGRPSASPPGGVPTLALWAGAVDRPIQGEIGGAINVTVPNQEHVEVATSAEAFAEMYRFFTGREPRTTDVLVEHGRIRLEGRAVIFPDNAGIDGATVEAWALDPRTGERRGRRPRASVVVGPDGDFSFVGPQRRHWELVVKRNGELPLHYFFERFPRSDHLVRLNAAPILEPFFPMNEGATGMAVIRYKEFWGDRGPENDVLSIDGTDVINATTAPSGAVGAASVTFFAFDANGDGMTDLQSIPPPFTIVPFLTGADLYIPVGDTPIPIVTVPRGDASARRQINIRRIPSTQGRTVVQLHDYER
jgi:pimeloyl-ACP methyl ester carboxylesterase